MSAEQRLVVVAPHPDDEILACGGLIAMHVDRGGSVLVISVTDGEASHSRRGDVSALARTRRAERLSGLAALKLNSPTIERLSIPDGEVAIHRDRVEHIVGELLVTDDLVVTTWHLDGHPDHEATGSGVARACAKRDVRRLGAPVWMWNWARPDDPRVPWRELRGLRLTGAAVNAKKQALSCHSSQLTPRNGGEGPVVDAEMIARAGRDHEYYFHGDIPC